MSEEHGIKELQEVLEASHAIALFVIERAKDGIGVDDAGALVTKVLSDEEFKAKVSAAVEGVGKVPAEVKDLSLNEGMQLAMWGVGIVPSVVEALKKEEPAE